MAMPRPTVPEMHMGVLARNIGRLGWHRWFSPPPSKLVSLANEQHQCQFSYVKFGVACNHKLAISCAMILAQITDTHLMTPNPLEPRAATRARALKQSVTDINNLDPRPDAVIHTGDMTQTAASTEVALASELLAPLAMPLYVTPGNRDGRQPLTGIFIDEDCVADGGFVHYAIDRHPVRLVAVDSLSGDNNKGNFCRARLDALDVTLSQAPDRPTALFMHHPPFDVAISPYPFHYNRRQAVVELAAVVSCHGHVVHIFTGHSHRHYVARFGGTVASTMPSVAPDLRQGNYPAAMADRPVYQLHRFDARVGFVSETRLVDA